VRVSPRAGRDALGGLWRDADGRAWLCARLAAAPADGAANAALIPLVARALGVRKADVTLANGASSRLKRLVIRGEPDRLAAQLPIIAGETE